MTVRNAAPEDLDGIAKVHAACFPDSFSTHLGRAHGFRLLKKFYSLYLKSVPELFLVAENGDGKMIGLCMGYYCEDNTYMKRYLKENFFAVSFRMFLLLLCGDRTAWRKIRSVFEKNETKLITEEFEYITDDRRGDLLSVCVVVEERGKGTAQALMDEYLRILKANGRELCLLTVEKENARGKKFYEKNGFVPYKDVGSISMGYAKKL